MYFVAYIVQPSVNVVVPHAWIKHFGKIIESFLNNGITSNQYFSVFWTNNSDAFGPEGIPHHDYPPNMNASEHAVFPQEGWYSSQIRCFKGECNAVHIQYSSRSSSFL